MRVLIVEDDQTTGGIVSDYLTSEGIENRWSSSFDPHVIVDFVPTHILLAHAVFNTQDVKKDVDLVQRLCKMKIFLMSTANPSAIDKELMEYTTVILKPFDIDTLNEMLRIHKVKT